MHAQFMTQRAQLLLFSRVVYIYSYSWREQRREQPSPQQGLQDQKREMPNPGVAAQPRERDCAVTT